MRANTKQPRAMVVKPVETGQLAFAPGSSGWTNAQAEQMHWMEVFLRGGNAWESFNRPAIGTHINIS
ncbi:hypothetical protein [Nostoc sp. FACHB-888]|uniref:hypothetical protein n=1 Tax=Nostoc sp. FACHB-888 TaxID=2692842 RepID=UPI001689BD8B|nr:hypothetical protein [Nostoc sp. FACHB-888]MBD2248467.1 hypothetical protein [Nostoc sp. FACHB-888]